MSYHRLVYRHRLWVRITHWINVIWMTILLMSGLQIFNAHPAVYWGNVSHFDTPLVAVSGFPGWATLPGSQWLAMGGRWHFFFAWLFVASGVAYALLTIIRGHLCRDLVPTATDLRQIGRTTGQHLRFRFPKSEEAMHYNVLHSPISASFACFARSSFLRASQCRRSSTRPTRGCSGSLADDSRRVQSTSSAHFRFSVL